jgi:nitrogen regulatory protein PII
MSRFRLVTMLRLFIKEKVVTNIISKAIANKAMKNLWGVSVFIEKVSIVMRISCKFTNTILTIRSANVL